ncbi:MAG: sigma-70 family RNA polymerase sigma factor [Polyangiaceae bacterium]|nr:sigma-70 family RNA polymerase sigma factor [Polyangiaceae bacterium]
MPTDRRPEGGAPFPTTITSAVLALKSEDTNTQRDGWERVARAYLAPIERYVALRFRLTAAEAADTSQAFFARALEKGTFSAFDPTKARFRTYVRTCLDRFVVDERRRNKAMKRGGDAITVEIDDEHAVAMNGPDPDACFEDEWKKHVLERALERLREDLRASKKTEHLTVFERFHLETDTPPSYSAIASELGITVTDVTNRLSYARRKLRAMVIDILREITASEEEFRAEAKAVLGVDL